KGSLCCSHRKINVVCVAVGHLRIGFTCGRLDVVEISAADRLDEFAVDEVADANQSLGHNKLHAETSRDSSTSLGMTRKRIGLTNSPLMKFRICDDSMRM